MPSAALSAFRRQPVALDLEAGQPRASGIVVGALRCCCSSMRCTRSATRLASALTSRARWRAAAGLGTLDLPGALGLGAGGRAIGEEQATVGGPLLQDLLAASVAAARERTDPAHRPRGTQGDEELHDGGPAKRSCDKPHCATGAIAEARKSRCAPCLLRLGVRFPGSAAMTETFTLLAPTRSPPPFAPSSPRPDRARAKPRRSPPTWSRPTCAATIPTASAWCRATLMRCSRAASSSTRTSPCARTAAPCSRLDGQQGYGQVIGQEAMELGAGARPGARRLRRRPRPLAPSRPDRPVGRAVRRGTGWCRSTSSTCCRGRSSRRSAAATRASAPTRSASASRARAASRSSSTSRPARSPRARPASPTTRGSRSSPGR